MPFGPVGDEELSTFTAVEKARMERLNHYEQAQTGYFHIQAKRPQTLAYSLNNSPVGQLAWIVDIFKEFSLPVDALPEAAIARDDMLTNVMLYWLTGTGGSSAHLYYESMHSDSWHETAAATPTGVAVFANDVAIRRYAEYGNNIVHWSDFDEGGHFAAMEVPELLVKDVRSFFRQLR